MTKLVAANEYFYFYFFNWFKKVKVFFAAN